MDHYSHRLIYSTGNQPISWAQPPTSSVIYPTALWRLRASKLSFRGRAHLIKLFDFLGMCSCTFSTCTLNLLALQPAVARQLSSSPVNHINGCCLGCIPVVVVVLLFWSMPRGGVLLSRYEEGSFFSCRVDVGSSLAASLLIPKLLGLHMEANREWRCSEQERADGFLTYIPNCIFFRTTNKGHFLGLFLVWL